STDAFTRPGERPVPDGEGEDSVANEAGPVLAAAPAAEPGSTKARVCWTASTLQPQARELPCRATGWPSMIVVASPSTTGKTPLCFGQTAWSVTRATGLPSTLVNADPVMTRPPLSVVSPTTIHILAVKRHPVQSPLNGWNCN